MVFGKKKKAVEETSLEDLQKQKEELEKKLKEAGEKIMEEAVEEEVPQPVKKTVTSTEGKRYVVKEFPTEYSKAIVDEKDEVAYDAFSVMAEILNKLDKLEKAIG